MRHLVETQGLVEEVVVDSAGTSGYHVGEAPDTRMHEAAARRGYSLTGAARQFVGEDFERFDLIVAMDRENLRGIQAVGEAREGQLHLLSDFLPDGALPDVPDPYYGGDQGFETVLDMIEEACPEILATLAERQESS